MSPLVWAALAAVVALFGLVVILELVATIREQRGTIERQDSELASLMQVMHSERSSATAAERELAALGWPGAVAAGQMLRHQR